MLVNGELLLEINRTLGLGQALRECMCAVESYESVNFHIDHNTIAMNDYCTTIGITYMPERLKTGQ